MNYIGLPAKTAQQIIKLVVNKWQLFFVTNAAYQRNPEQFTEKPKKPKYHPEGSKLVLIINNQQVGKITNGQGIIFPGKTGLVLPTGLVVGTLLNGAWLVPNYAGYIVKILYETAMQEAVTNPQLIVDIGFGIENLVTIVNNIGLKSIVEKDKVFKVMNQ